MIYWVMSPEPLADYALATQALVKAVTENGIEQRRS